MLVQGFQHLLLPQLCSQLQPLTDPQLVPSSMERVSGSRQCRRLGVSVRAVGGGGGGRRGGRGRAVEGGAVKPDLVELRGVTETGARLLQVVQEPTIAARHHELEVEGKRLRQPVHLLQPPPVSLQQVQVLQHQVQSARDLGLQQKRRELLLERLVVQLGDASSEVELGAKLEADSSEQEGDVLGERRAPDTVIDHPVAPALILEMLHHRLKKLGPSWTRLADESDRPVGVFLGS
mmetsp:Transcript_14685/g.50126  ORF Transcript_14685/g.50126 Transcript_14685/m.50126 type:complete len:235 (-) Transcript_14685:1966-2670(-)